MKALNLVATCVFGGVLLIAGIALAGQEKIDVCHITGTYDFGSGDVPVGHVINIAVRAYPAHYDHGDPMFHALIEIDGETVCTDAAYVGTDKVLFSTSSEYQGDLVGAANALLSTGFGAGDGLAAADAICQYHADLTSSIVPSGEYIAVISSGEWAARDVLADTDGPIVDSLGDVLEDTWYDMFHNKPFERLIITENGDRTGGLVWTGATSEGGVSGVDCLDWTSESEGEWGRFGKRITNPAAAGENATKWIYWPDVWWCSSFLPLYCIQQ